MQGLKSTGRQDIRNNVPYDIMSLEHAPAYLQVQQRSQFMQWNHTTCFENAQGECDYARDLPQHIQSPARSLPKASDTTVDHWANLKLTDNGLQISAGPDGKPIGNMQKPDTQQSWRTHDHKHVEYIIKQINQSLADPGSMIYLDAELEDETPDPFPRPVQSKTTWEFLRSFMTDAPDTGTDYITIHDYLDDDDEDAASIVRAIRNREI